MHIDLVPPGSLRGVAKKEAAEMRTEWDVVRTLGEQAGDVHVPARLIEAALERMVSAPDSYGLDENSGEPIPFERLDIIPWARTTA